MRKLQLDYSINGKLNRIESVIKEKGKEILFCDDYIVGKTTKNFTGGLVEANNINELKIKWGRTICYELGMRRPHLGDPKVVVFDDNKI